MLSRLTLRGRGATLVWGYRTAAELPTWAISRESAQVGGDGVWKLTATIARVDKFQIRQRPLLFTAPRPGGIGLFCFPVTSIEVGATAVLATLGAPEY